MPDPLDFFDEEKAMGELRGRLEESNSVRRNSQTTIVEAQSDIEAANQSFLRAMEGFQPLFDKEIEDTQKILDNLDRIDSEGILADLKGIIMPSYNEETQTKALQRQSLQLDLLSNRAANMQKLYQARITADSARIENANRIYQFTRDKFLDSAKLATLGFQLDAQIHEKLVQSLEDQTLEKLTAWRDGNDLAELPEAIRKLPEGTQQGLIELVWMNKRGAQANLTSAVLTNRLQEENVSIMERGKKLRAFTDEQLVSISAGSRKPPEGLELEDVNQELARRQERALSLETTELALAAGRHDLVMAQQAKYLSTHSAEELGDLLKAAEAAPTKTITVNKIPFTAQMITDALGKRASLDREAQKAQHERVLNSEAAMNSVAELRGMVEGVIRADNPDIDTEGVPLETMLRMLPAEEQGKVNSLVKQYETAAVLNDAELVNKKAEEIGTVIKGYQEKIIKRTPEDRQGGMREWMQTGDIKDRGNIVNWLASSDSPYLLSNVPVWGAAYKQFHTKLAENKNRKDSGIILGQDETGASRFTTVNQKFSPTEAVTKTIGDLNLQLAIRDGLFEQYLGQTLGRLTKVQDPAGNVYAELMSGFINPRTGQLGPMFYAQDEAGNSVFSYRKASQVLAAAEEKGRLSGVLMANESLYTLVLDTLNRDVAAFSSGQDRNNPDYVAFKNAVFPRGMTSDMAAAVANLEVYEAESRDLVMQQTAELQQEIEAATQVQMEIDKISPQFDPHDPHSGLRRRILKQRQAGEARKKATANQGTFENVIRSIIGGD